MFPIPFFSGDFEDAPELERIGDALIRSCDEFALLKWALDEQDAKIYYVWKKKASKSADRFKAGTLGKAAGLVKHLAEANYVVTIARDVNFGATHWQMEALVYHELKHIKVEEQIVGKGDQKVAVPDLKVRAHDLEMFDSEIERYGLWRKDLQRAQTLFAQVPLFRSTASTEQAASDGDSASATITMNGKPADLGDRRAARKLVQDAVTSAFSGRVGD